MKRIESALNRKVKLVAGCAMLFIVTACASTKPPTAKMSETESAIKQAEQVDAQDYAPLEIREARKKFDQAKQMVKQEKYAKAKRLADEAMVDAELAEITARSKKAQEAVKQLRESIKTLKEEIERNQNRQGG